MRTALWRWFAGVICQKMILPPEFSCLADCSLDLWLMLSEWVGIGGGRRVVEAAGTVLPAFEVPLARRVETVFSRAFD